MFSHSHNIQFFRRMVKSLLENQTLYLEKYLHELIPAVTTCIVARQLCTRPDVDNHWALRDFASRLMVNICKNFNTSTNNIQIRITRMFSDALISEKTPLVSCYGAVEGLVELGPEVIKSVVIPQIKAVSKKLDSAIANMQVSANPALDKKGVENIRNLVLKTVVPVLKSSRNPPDVADEYMAEFGSLGAPLCDQVQKSRKSSQATSAQPVSQAAPAHQNLMPSGSSPQVINQPGQRYQFVVNNPQGGQNPQQRIIVATTAAGQQGQPRLNYGIQYYQGPPQ